LHEVYARLRHAGGPVIEQGETACCYAKSEKSWIEYPGGIAWETFHTTGENTDYGDGTGERDARVANAKACCVPAAAGAAESAGVCCTTETAAACCPQGWDRPESAVHKRVAGRRYTNVILDRRPALQGGLK
jgi:hypothetical protein